MSEAGGMTRRTMGVLAVDAAALILFWVLMPRFSRPLDILCILAFALSIATIVLAGPSWVKSAALMAAVLSLCVFGLEMAEKRFDIVEKILSGNKAPAAPAEPERREKPYGFSATDSDTWLAARERALRDGADPADFKQDFAGDVFAGVAPDQLRVRSTHALGRIETLVTAGDAPRARSGPLGVENRPNFKHRSYATNESADAMLWDGVATTDAQGFRITKCAETSPEITLFLGCSYTFGNCLSDWETLPWFYSEGFGFSKRVINTGIGGAGPHHSLRDLELDYRLGRAGIDPGQVKAVYYSFIEDHMRRVVTPHPPDSPRYVLRNGEAVYVGAFSSVESLGRLGLLFMRSRIFPVLYNRITNAAMRDEELTFAILAKMHRLCGERYGVPLTVVDWWENEAFSARMRETGMVVVPVSRAFGPDWRDWEVKYFLADSHPAACANRMLARHLVARERREGGGEVAGEATENHIGSL